MLPLYAAEPLEQRLLLAVLYVDVNAPGPVHDGLGWDSAYVDLQQALGKAQAGDQIRIAGGTYKPTTTANRAKSFQLKSGVALYGGYGGHAAADPDLRDLLRFPTILSGEIGDPAKITDNSYHVVYASGVDATAILDGLTITAGNANGDRPNSSGGGMYSTKSSSPRLTNCTFTGNSARDDGGGTYNSDSSPTFANCIFSGNRSGIFGGGMYNSSSSPAISNCTFIRNTATAGGGMCNTNGSSPAVTNCTFIRNLGWYDGVYGAGGGMYNDAKSSPALANCTFNGNSSCHYGGGMCNSYSSSPTLVNCTFSGNSAIGRVNASITGGGIYNQGSSTLTNCTFSGNVADGGAAIAGEWGSTTTLLVNCILWGNTATSPAAGQQSQCHGAATITQTLIQGGWKGKGAGNLDADPQFVRNPSPGPDGQWGTPDDDYGDLRLRSTSPAINAGSNAALPSDLTTDLAGKPRLIGGTVDLGAYEYQNDELALAGSATDAFHLRITGSTLEVFRNTQPNQAPPTQSVPLSNLRQLHLQGGQYTLASNLAGLELYLESDSQVKLASSQRLAFLSFSPGAALDLADHDLIVSATPETRQAALAAISTAIKSARGSDGQWLGSGLGSSLAKANKQTGLAILLNEKDGKPILTAFAGQSVNENEILVKYTWNGDMNLDGVVDAADYFLVDSGYITQEGQYRNGDLNLDGTVDAADYFLVDSAYIAQTGVLTASKPTFQKTPVLIPTHTAMPNLVAELFSTKPLL